MMNSYRPTNTGRNSRQRLLGVTLLIVFLFMVDALLGGRVRTLARGTLATLLSGTRSAWGAVLESGAFSTKSHLEAENKRLSEALAEFHDHSAAYDFLKQENEQLRALLQLSAGEKGIAAPVISSDRSSPYGTFLIGAGSIGGVEKGNLVLTGAGFVVGRVSDVSARSSLVSEVFAPNLSTDAIIRSTSVVVEGEGAENGRTKVPRGVVIVPGDIVIAPAYGNRPIGIVGHVASSSASGSEDISIRLPTTLSALQFVYVISK